MWFPLYLCSKWCTVFEISGAQMFLLFPDFYLSPVAFPVSLPSWWTLERTICKGDEVALYFCFSLTSILLRLLFPVYFTSWWMLERTMCKGDEVVLYFCFLLTSILLRVFEGALSLALLELSHLCYKAQMLYLIVTVSPLSQNRWGNSNAVNVSSEKTCCLLE